MPWPRDKKPMNAMWQMGSLYGAAAPPKGNAMARALLGNGYFDSLEGVVAHADNYTYTPGNRESTNIEDRRGPGRGSFEPDGGKYAAALEKYYREQEFLRRNSAGGEKLYGPPRYLAGGPAKYEPDTPTSSLPPPDPEQVKNFLSLWLRNTPLRK